MPEIKLKIEELALDHDNPRITHAEGQQDALQKIVREQKTKLVKLAQSIVQHGLNPMDRLLVIPTGSKPERYVAVEGNRRVAVLKLLTNPAVMTGLEMPSAMRTAFEKAARGFSRSKVEPIFGFELPSRQEGNYWLELRHRGEQGGAGIVPWLPNAQQRFLHRSPAVQALDMVTERGGLSAAQREQVTDRFPVSTLQRFVEDTAVRAALGLDVKKGKLVTRLPASEVVKPLKRIVLDLATKQRRVGSLMRTSQMLDYVKSFGKSDSADMSKALATERAVDEIPITEFAKPARQPRRKPDASDRREVVPRSCTIHVTNNRIAEIYKELRTLKLENAPNSIAVLMRVFLEMSVDHFLEARGVELKFKPPNGSREQWKSLKTKLAEAIAILIKIGVPKAHLDQVEKDQKTASSPMSIESLNDYVHNRFATPSPPVLKAAWDHAQPLFEKIWLAP